MSADITKASIKAEPYCLCRRNSLGDYVLTNGAIAAVVVADAVIRLLPGVSEAIPTGGIFRKRPLLEYPQYTRPVDFQGLKVPEVLLSEITEITAGVRNSA